MIWSSLIYLFHPLNPPHNFNRINLLSSSLRKVRFTRDPFKVNSYFSDRLIEVRIIWGVEEKPPARGAEHITVTTVWNEGRVPCREVRFSWGSLSPPPPLLLHALTSVLKARHLEIQGHFSLIHFTQQYQDWKPRQTNAFCWTNRHLQATSEWVITTGYRTCCMRITNGRVKRCVT